MTPRKARKKSPRPNIPSIRVFCRESYHYVSMVNGGLVLSHHNFKKELAHIEMGGAECPCVTKAKVMIQSLRCYSPGARAYRFCEDQKVWSYKFSDNINRSYIDPRTARVHQIMYLLLRYKLKLSGERLRLKVDVSKSFPFSLGTSARGRRTDKGYDIVIHVYENWIQQVWKRGWATRYNMLALSVVPIHDKSDHVSVSAISSYKLKRVSKDFIDLMTTIIDVPPYVLPTIKPYDVGITYGQVDDRDEGVSNDG
jgi:hypothetical protein